MPNPRKKKAPSPTRKSSEQDRLASFSRDVSLALIQSDSLPDMLRHCAEAMVRYLDGAFARIWTFDAAANVLELRASAGMYTHLDGPHSRIPIGQYMIGWIAQERQPHLTNSVIGDPRISDQEWAKREGIVAFAGYPLIVDDRLVGVMAMFARHALTERTVDAMGTIANGIALGVERKAGDERLREQTATAATLNRVGSLLAVELDLHKLVQVVTDEGTQLTGAQFGAFFYNVIGSKGESYMLYTLSGVPREAFDRFPMPQNTQLFGPTFRGEGVVRLADVTKDARYGKTAPYYGMPPGHLPVRSYLAVPVISRSGEVLGGLFFGHSDIGVFTRRHEQLLTGVAGQAATAIDNARLFQRAQATAERLNLALSAAELGDWSWDAATDTVTLSERAAEIFGIPPGPQMTWTAMLELLDPRDRDRAKKAVVHVVAERTPYDIEYRVNRADGRSVWVGVLGRAIYDASHRVSGMFGVVQDISERKRLEESVRAEESRFRGLMEQAPFSIQVFAPDGTTVRVNRAWEELWGAKVEQIPQYNILQDKQLESRGVLPYIQRAFEGEAVYIPAIQYDPNETIPNVTQNENSVRWVGAVAYPLKNDAGQVREVVVVHEDITARRRAEVALRESEEKLRLLADTIPQLAWMANPDGHIFWYNRRWYEYTGTTPQQMEGWGWQSVHDPEVLPEVLARWRSSLASGEPFDMVFPLRGADGVFHPFLTRVNPLRDDRNRILYWFGTNTDVTELREARQALAESEERLRLALDAGRMGVWDWNIRTNELKWSDSLEPLHGLEPGTFGGTLAAFQELIHPDDRAVVNEAIQRAIEAQADFQIEFRNLWRDGSLHWIAGKGKVFPGDDRLPHRMIGIGMDVTHQKRSEWAARFLADASAALAVLADFESTLERVSSLAVPDFADWVTVDMAESDGSLRRAAVAHVDPAKAPLAYELHRRFPPDLDAARGMWNIMRTGRPELVQRITDDLLSRTLKDPDLLDLLRQLGFRSYIGVPLRARGKTLGVINFVSADPGHLYDETDLAVAEDLASRTGIAIENMQLYRELRDADRRKDEFLATLAHELRNPLAPIRNGLQVLRLAAADSDAVLKARTMMERQLTQMVRLVDDLLDVSRITRNKLDLRKKRVELAEVVHSAIETSRPLIEQAGHTFSVTLPPVPIHLDADPVRLAQVFSNLLNNSAKYTEPKGAISFAAELAGDEIVVRVRDNGIGIPAESLPRIFEMFSQVDRNLERAQGGLGIGLTLVRRMVEMHGGSVEARSEGLGQGSEFVVRLPVMQAELPVSESLSADAGTPVSKRILVVDDNADSAMSLELMLRIMGNETRTAEDGLAAVEAADEFRPDLILLDIGLPKLNGYEACRLIREQPWSKNVTIVALTGWGQDEDRRRSHEAGFDQHMVKPIDINQLKRLLASDGHSYR